MQLRRAEQPHPVVRVRNPRDNELWLSEQQKRNTEFATIYGRYIK